MRVALIICCALTACRTTPEPLPAADAPLPPGRFVEVQPGQTVWELSRLSGLSVEEIVEVNGLENPNELAAGQLIFLPEGPALPKTLTTPTTPTTTKTPTKPPPAVSASGLVWPADGVVLRTFGGGYDGVLIAAPAGTAVVAAAKGKVAFAGDQQTALGAFIIIDHAISDNTDSELVTIYGHLSRVDVKVGDVVTLGQAIGAVGTSGLVGMSPRVHFQVRRKKVPVDPLAELSTSQKPSQPEPHSGAAHGK